MKASPIYESFFFLFIASCISLKLLPAKVFLALVNKSLWKINLTKALRILSICNCVLNINKWFVTFQLIFVPLFLLFVQHLSIFSCQFVLCIFRLFFFQRKKWSPRNCFLRSAPIESRERRDWGHPCRFPEWIRSKNNFVFTGIKSEKNFWLKTLGSRLTGSICRIVAGSNPVSTLSGVVVVIAMIDQ